MTKQTESLMNSTDELLINQALNNASFPRITLYPGENLLIGILYRMCLFRVYKSR